MNCPYQQSNKKPAGAGFLLLIKRDTSALFQDRRGVSIGGGTNLTSG